MPIHDIHDDEFEGASGLPLDGTEVTIGKNSMFGFSQNFGTDTVVAIFDFETADGQTRTQDYSCGKGWNVIDGGAAVENNNPEIYKFNSGTNYAQWVAAALALPGVAEEFKARRGTPRSMDTWIGSRWVLGTVQREVKNPQTGVTKTSSRLIPVKFLGYTGTNGAVKAAANPADELASDVLDALVLLAVTCHEQGEDHTAFVRQALNVAGVKGNQAAIKAIQANNAASIWGRTA